MAFRLERVNQVDNVGVRAELVVVLQFLGKFVDCKAGCIISGVRLGQALDGNQFICINVLSKMNHAKRAMVEKLDGFEASIKTNAVSLVDFTNPTLPKTYPSRRTPSWKIFFMHSIGTGSSSEEVFVF